MQTLSDIHDINETGAEWLDLREAMEELNKQNAKEQKARKKQERKLREIQVRETRIRAASKLYADYKKNREQGVFEL